MTDRLELPILGNGDFLEYGSPRISACGLACMFHKLLLIGSLENIGEGRIHRDYVRLSLLVENMCCVKTFVLIVGCALGEVWNVINFLWEGKVT